MWTVRRYAAELVALTPDVILSNGTATMAAMQQTTRTVPMVFVHLPIRSGPESSIASRGQAAMPPVYAVRIRHEREMARIAQRDRATSDSSGGHSGPRVPPGVGQFAAIQTVAPTFRVDVHPVGVHDAAEIERGVTAFARGSNDGLIVTSSTLSVVHGDMIIALAARHQLPAVYGIP